MIKLISPSVLAFLFSGAVMASDSVSGQWECMMVSEYGDFEFQLTLNDDNTYANKRDMFGSVSIDSGNWEVAGEELKMHRTKTNEDGVEEASDFRFQREIVSVSDATLVLKHDDTITTCTK